LQRLLAAHDMRIVDVLPIPIHAGSIRVTAARAASARTASPVVATMLDAERAWQPEVFAAQVAARRRTLRDLVVNLRRAGKRVVAYGAAGRATILLNYCAFTPDLVEYVVDKSPLRYGKFVPGVDVPIVSPDRFHESPPDYAIMTAWNYQAEIVGREQAFLNGGGRFIIPLPEIQLAGPV
jgi:novobiocin biosynthesis protein NovU/D-mycarose 3-C-methyltransferase